MNRSLFGVLVATSALSAAMPVFAQESVPQDEAMGVGDIVVTARREAETLQDTPVSVQVISGATLENLAITDFRDIAKLAPGLSITTGGRPSVVLRGVRWQSQSGTPAVPVYFNEVPFNPVTTFLTLYDVGQIEVLRGPQGTARGAPSVPGAITLTTRRPNLNEIGGFVDGQYTSFHQSTVQGAISFPIIQDKLAIRIAGMFDEGDGNRVRSLNSSLEPFVRTISGRISLRFEPTSDLDFNLMAQHLDFKTRQFTGVFGTGSPGALFDPDTAAGPAAPGPNPLAPPNYNGPAIGLYDRLAVQAVPATTHQKTSTITFNANWKVAGHTLTYILGYERTTAAPDRSGSPVGNQVQGYLLESVNRTIGASTSFIQELRLSSIRGDNFIDYDIGAFYSRTKSKFEFVQFSPLPGAFGSFFAPPNPVITNPAVFERYLLPSRINVDLQSKNYSFYGTAYVHLPGDVELTAGIRWIHDQRPFLTQGPIGPGFLSLPPFAFSAPSCAALAGIGATPSAAYPGQCDFPYAILGQPTSIQSNYDETFTPVIYNVSLSRKFGEDVLLYATVGSSYRIGVPNTGTSVSDPALEKSREEYATSYELGLKTSFLNRQLTLNAAIFQLDYKNQIAQFAQIPYFNVARNQPDVTSNFFSNVDARVRGFEIDMLFRPNRRLTLGANISYAKITSKGGLVPCDIGAPGATGDGLSATNQMNFCPSLKGETVNPTSPFQASVNGSYSVPLGSVEAYFRFLVDINGNNPNYGAGGVNVGSYAIVDLFAGINEPRQTWDIGVFAKNVFDKRVLLNSATVSAVDAGLGVTGYSTYNVTAPREFGVSLRYAFGSR
jgi:iron complex outermembrane receptor protein